MRCSSFLRTSREVLEWHKIGHPKYPELGLWAAIYNETNKCKVAEEIGMTSEKKVDEINGDNHPSNFMALKRSAVQTIKQSCILD